MNTTAITQRTINSIEATGSPYFIRDSNLRGFGIKVTGRGKASFIVEKRVRGGRVVRQKLGDVDLLSLREAKEAATTTLLRLSKGEDVNKTRAIEDSPNDSLAKHLSRYIETKHDKLAEGTVAGYRNIMKAFFSDWMNTPVNAISQSLIIDKRNQLLKEGKSSNYVSRGFRTLKAVLNTSDLPINPVNQAMKKWGLSLQSSNRSHYLSQETIVEIFTRYELENLFRDKALGVYTFIVFLLLTGCRKSEAIDLLWSDVSETTIRFRDTKNKKDHVVPLWGMLKDILNTQPRINERVFGFTQYTLRTRFEPVGKELGFTAHDLRRTFAEHSNFAGFDSNMIGMALNHTPTGVTQKNYLSGELAKLTLMENFYSRYQTQLIYYYLRYGQKKAPDNFKGLEAGKPISWKYIELWGGYLEDMNPEMFEELMDGM